MTDGDPAGAVLCYPVQHVPALFERMRPAPELYRAIEEFGPDVTLVLTGAHELFRPSRFRLPGRVFALIGNQLFSGRELGRLSIQGIWLEWSLVKIPLLASTLGRPFLGHFWAKSGLAGAAYFSEASRSRHVAAGLPDGPVVLPQVGSVFSRRQWKGRGDGTLLYFGPPLLLRGADTAVRAFEQGCRAGFNGRLVLLLRAQEPYSLPSLRRVETLVERSPFRSRIKICTSYLSPEEIAAEVEVADAVLLPFKIVLSDPPLVTIEAGLSGCPLITFDTPGVSEFVHHFGGQVANSTEELASAMTRAVALAGSSPPPGGAVWHDWAEAVKPLAQTLDRDIVERLRDWRLICLCGVDGAGKTTLLRAICGKLDARKIAHRHVWLRFQNYLSKPLLALTRLTGHNYKVRVAGILIGYHDFQHNRLIGLSFLALQWIDNFLGILIRYRLSGRKALVMGDRSVLDTLVDLAVDTNLDGIVFGRYGRSLLALLPKPNAIVIVERPGEMIARDRPDACLERHQERRRELYRRAAVAFDLPLFVNAGDVDTGLQRVLRIIAEGER